MDCQLVRKMDIARSVAQIIEAMSQIGYKIARSCESMR